MFEAGEYKITSRYGVLRDLIFPVYGIAEALSVAGLLLAICVFLYMLSGLEYVLPELVGAFVGVWVQCYRARPLRITVARTDASAIEMTLRRSKFFSEMKSNVWRGKKDRWWSSWPHEVIAVADGRSGVDVVAPKRLMKFVLAVLNERARNISR
ncbi:hypothetical protein [Acetobacter nitrogenifigens]|uniref:Uncharacterized protein n=1 Tax=Acetobacter nitrogenifigens DSM 23921 = NBRC 105050 TaxID=1120919 RepID=A0A511XDV6_9PROT|nr:hypothetical protein [Acetobacter nitrogenifigens]GEN61144.1 hypothetical protein ANI02nite_30280 [Acetobacter nitrogenifigens DSM 23921 = NBRC 105050]